MRYQIRYCFLFIAVLFFLSIWFIRHTRRSDDNRHDKSHNLRTATSWNWILNKSSEYPSINEIDHFASGYNELNSAKSRQHLIEYLDFPARVEPYNFRECRMSTCFDISRCINQKPIKIFIKEPTNNQVGSGENNIKHQNMIKILQRSKYYVSDPNEACIFIPGEDTLDRDPLSPSFVSNLNNLFGPKDNLGMNHLVFNLYSGSWPDYAEDDFADISMNAAIIAKASASLNNHRSGFDISIPLFSSSYPLDDESLQRVSTTTTNRTFLLTFKGKRYVFGSGSETRNSLYHIDNQRDVIMLSTCRHGKSWQDSVDDRCALDEAQYVKYDFVDLMKQSVFCLTPRGRRLGSYRFLEALQYGCIPVILSNGWIKPFDDIIDWSKASLQYDERLILQVPDFLRDISKSEIDRLRKNGQTLYNTYVSNVEKILLTTIYSIEDRIDHLIRENIT